MHKTKSDITENNEYSLNIATMIEQHFANLKKWKLPAVGMGNKPNN
jgi:hypothetical protein